MSPIRADQIQRPPKPSSVPAKAEPVVVTDLGFPIQDPDDADYEPGGSPSGSARFRPNPLQAAIGLTDNQEFSNFTAQLRMIMKQVFDVQLQRTHQPEANHVFRATILEEFPDIMGGNTEEKMRLVTHYLNSAYGAWRYNLKHGGRRPQRDVSSIVDVDDEEEAGGPSPLNLRSSRRVGDISNADKDMERNFRSLSLSIPPSRPSSSKIEIVPSSQSPPSSPKKASDLPSALSGSKLVSFTDKSNVNKRTTASLTPPETRRKADISQRPTVVQRVRSRSPSIELLSSPPPGFLSSCSPKRRKICPESEGANATTRVPPQSKPPRKPKHTGQSHLKRPPPMPESPSKRRKNASAVNVPPQRRTVFETSASQSSTSTSRQAPSSSTLTASSSAAGPSAQQAQSSQPKREALLTLSGAPARHREGICLFLRSCKPPMDHLLPAFVEAGCTLPVLKAVSAWSPKDMDEMWIPKIRKVVEAMMRESQPVETNTAPSSKRITNTRADGAPAGMGPNEGRGDGKDGSATAMRELTEMDGVILRYHLKEFWKTHC